MGDAPPGPTRLLSLLRQLHGFQQFRHAAARGGLAEGQALGDDADAGLERHGAGMERLAWGNRAPC
jgi:hypothetical protein